MNKQEPKDTASKVAPPPRIVTATSLFDGHDAAINIMRRILQSSGAEVIHLGHNRSVAEIVSCAIQEDAQAIAITSYQGGHIEFFKYMHDLLQEASADIRIFGGGGGTILPSEIQELHEYGIDRIYSPDDGRALGLQGMIDDLLGKCKRPEELALSEAESAIAALAPDQFQNIARLITLAENSPEKFVELKSNLSIKTAGKKIPVLGITGPGGAGKSSLVDELVRRFLADQTDKRIAVISVDPSKRKTGGALLGDRIRMNSIDNSRVYMRSLATRQSHAALSKHLHSAIDVAKAANFDLIIVETSGIGQSDSEIVEHVDATLYVMTAEYGAATQLEKIDMLDFADVVAINKFDKRGSLDALRDVRKQFKRNRNLFDESDDNLPIFSTIASQFNDKGMHQLYRSLMNLIASRTQAPLSTQFTSASENSTGSQIIPGDRSRYLAEISESSTAFDKFVDQQATLARQLYQLLGTFYILQCRPVDSVSFSGSWQIMPLQLSPIETSSAECLEIARRYNELIGKLHHECKELLRKWPETVARFTAEHYKFQVRDRIIELPLYTESLSHLQIPKIALPRAEDWGEILRWLLTENIPGEFPYAAGVFPLKRQGEDPARMFAGEGGPERTNRRFHYVSQGMPAKRLSTAFDSVTLYGEDPDKRPDIYGKIGNAGVSIATLDDAKKLYSGFDLSDPSTSVSMTINGPAPMILGFYMNAAIDQQCEIYIRNHGMAELVQAKLSKIFSETQRPSYNGEIPKENDHLGLMLLGVTGDQVLPLEIYEKIKAETLTNVRGTVQADILKEDQAQNTCIFSTEFALRMMGDVQQYFIDHNVRNFYSVSISGYHIAEAGANPVTQLALTLANGFTYVEYFLSRGMKIDDFAPNLSFFFSNGIDPEYSVIGRVARRIWAKAIKNKYHGNERSQKLKYHIQTSGRSLHAQEIAFNDIRTTLQALYALNDNCNSLHTNAYDEAITTPTEESVRRAMAIQLIINKEFGLSKNENSLQGSFIIEELTDLVEKAVLQEFNHISERGGVLGAMERMYQRTKIQEESMYYESLKHDGKLPLIGVNTFLDSKGSPTIIPAEVIRSTDIEKKFAIDSLDALHLRNLKSAPTALAALQQAAVENQNIFAKVMEASKVCSIGQMSKALYMVGGQYRRNM